MIPPLATLFARYPADARPIAEPEPLGNAGGLSGARLWKYAASRGSLVVRAWPLGGRPVAEIQVIHAWLNRAGNLGFVPVPIRGRDESSLHEVAGEIWEIAPWMPGLADLSEPPAASRVASAFAAIAAFHDRVRNNREHAFSPGLASRARELATLPQRIVAWRTVVNHAPDDPIREMALAWMAIARDLAPRLLPEIRIAASRVVPLQPVLRDARPDHVLFTGDRVTGLVDFGAMGRDAVSADLARLRADWLGDDPGLRSEALKAYDRVRPLSPTESDLIVAFERSAAILGGSRWVEWHFLREIPFADPSAVNSGLQRALAKIRSLADA